MRRLIQAEEAQLRAERRLGVGFQPSADRGIWFTKNWRIGFGGSALFFSICFIEGVSSSSIAQTISSCHCARPGLCRFTYAYPALFPFRPSDYHSGSYRAQLL
jgi:hypothetical protein